MNFRRSIIIAELWRLEVARQQQTTTVLRPFVWDYPGEPVPEETLTHPPSWSSSNLYQLLPSTTIHSILPVEIVCLADFLRNLWSRKTLNKNSFCVCFFWQKTTKFCSERIQCLANRRVMFKLRDIWPTGNRLCVIYLRKQQNFAWLSSSCYCADRAQNLPGSAPDNLLTVL